jgi:hypothetical protein
LHQLGLTAEQANWLAARSSRRRQARLSPLLGAVFAPYEREKSLGTGNAFIFSTLQRCSAQNERGWRSNAQAATSSTQFLERSHPMLDIVLLIVIVLLLVGAFPTWPHSRSWGYAPSGSLGLILIIVLIIVLLRHL